MRRTVKRATNPGAAMIHLSFLPAPAGFKRFAPFVADGVDLAAPLRLCANENFASREGAKGRREEALVAAGAAGFVA